MFSPTLEGPFLDAMNKMGQHLKAKAVAELGLSPDEVVVRPLRAEDIGFTNSQWKKLVAKSGTNSWNNIINTYTIADNRFIGINGYHSGFGQGTTKAFSTIRITIGSEVKRYWNVQAAEDLIGDSVYFDDPVCGYQNTLLTIEGYALTTNTTDKFVFFGLVAEKKGIIISP